MRHLLKKFIVIIFLWSFTFPAFAIVPSVIGSATTNQTSTTDTSMTFSHDCPSTGGNRMILILYVADSVAASSATYNAASATSIFSAPADSRYYSRAFYLANPASGINDVVVNWASTAGPKMVTAFCIQNAKQTSPIDQEASSGTTGQTSRTSTFTTTNNDVLGVHNTRVGLNATSLTQGESQTAMSNYQDPNGRWQNTGIKDWPTSGTNNISITWTTSTDVEQGAFGIIGEAAPVTAVAAPAPKKDKIKVSLINW